MNKRLKRLYTYMLKYKWTPAYQSCFWADRRKLNYYYYYVDLKENIDKERGRACFCLKENNKSRNG